MASSDLKIKNENPSGASIRIQSWGGKLPTYDNELQRGQALKAAAAFDVSEPPAINAEGAIAPSEELPDGYDKFKKDELIALANERKKAGKEIELDEADTVKILRDKIETTYPASDEGERKEDAEAKAEATPATPAELRYNFSEGNLLQEKTLAVGEEKVFTVNSDTFITIKIDA